MTNHHLYASGSERRRALQNASDSESASVAHGDGQQRAPEPWEVYRGGCIAWSPLCTAILTGTLVGLGLGGWIAEALRLSGR